MDKNRTCITISQVMMPNQANFAGNVHGGEIMKLMDSTAGAVAHRYARSNVVTARVDELEFLLPIFVGALVTCTARVAYAGRTSMEIITTIEVEDLESDDPPQKALTAFFTLVALDKVGKPKLVPELVIETEEERLLYEEGKKRREDRQLRKAGK
ncbi:MAG: acyl-CoA thioesterase [Clostridiales bacterium]|nr:acyl-CoA thioesterase [Clostridiales bacterium]